MLNDDSRLEYDELTEGQRCKDTGRGLWRVLGMDRAPIKIQPRIRMPEAIPDNTP